MPVKWPFAKDIIDLGGIGRSHISLDDAMRQTETAKTILANMEIRPGVLLADEVGMGKTFVAMAVISSVISATRREHCPVVVMAPPGLRQKWQRDWDQFKSHCIRNHALDWVRDEYAHTPTEFFKFLDDTPQERAQLIFITTGCFSRGLYDPWVKLAMLRLARSFTKLTDKQKYQLYRWASDLVRQFSNYKLTEDVVQKLMNTKVSDWKGFLVETGIMNQEQDDPVPKQLSKYAHKLKWDSLIMAIRNLPGWRPESIKESNRKIIRKTFMDAFKDIHDQWLNLTPWRSPLLVMDEAHHAKNDSTRLARLFRQESQDDIALLKDKFDRMIFLTATPFQLGHQELIRILRSFTAARWSSREAPEGTRETFKFKMDELEKALDSNRLAGRRFDRLWGNLRPEMIPVNLPDNKDENQRIFEWWHKVQAAPEDGWEQNLVQTHQDCVNTREHAERLLKPWLIRHNRPPYHPGATDIPRRNIVVGKNVRSDESNLPYQKAEGLPIDEHALLPFLITARAQGQLAQFSGARAFFAEGLASSYEAFHHTREGRLRAKDFDDGLKDINDCSAWLVPTKWYEEQIVRLIPSSEAPRNLLMNHPKVRATVERAVDLWLSGEKILIFCFYIQTAYALYEHIKEETNQKIISIAGEKIGLDARRHSQDIQKMLIRIVRRFTDEDSPFHKQIRSIIQSAMYKPQYAILERYREQILGVLMAYFRSPSFVARYLPLDDQRVREALAEREPRRQVIAKGIDALRHAIIDKKDVSNQTYLGRIEQFLDFACELAERAERRIILMNGELPDESDNPLIEYIKAVSIYSKPRKLEQIDKDDIEEDRDDGSYRVMPLVRMIYGGTKTEVRDHLMLAFNSPLFPEILVSSSVMGEGVDLHRFCRHVIHHDLCWNPSTLEQRTGRLDRVRCKAEVCLRPIDVYEPFIAGSADEKMFRVLRDRERWFQIVMGQKFEFDEAESEAIAARFPLPNELSANLTFDLSCWSTKK